MFVFFVIFKWHLINPILSAGKTNDALAVFPNLWSWELFFVSWISLLCCKHGFDTHLTIPIFKVPTSVGGGRVERRCWVNFQCRGVLLVWIIVGHGPIALAVGAGGGLFGHFFSRL